MKISRIKLKNWRNFLKLDIQIQDRLFIIGPNASGKSNFLDAFRFLKDLVTPGGGLQEALTSRGGLGKVRSLAARRDPHVEIWVELEETTSPITQWSYALSLRQKPRGKVELTWERVWKNDKLILNRPDRDDKNDPLRLTQTHLEQISANFNFRPIANFFNSIRYLHLVPQLVRYPNAFAGQGLPGDPFGLSFMERIAKTPDKTRKSRLKKIEEGLRLAVPHLKEISYVKDEMGTPHLEGIYEHWRPKAGKQREDQFSDGTLRLLGLLWTMLETNVLLLMEEPELSLNDGIVARLPGVMHRLTRQGRNRSQILVSTHSASLLSDKGLNGHEILLLTPKKEGTQAELASDIEDLRVLLESGMSPGDVVIPASAPKESEQLELFK